MKEEPFILDFDNDEQTVLEPDFENLPYHFHSRLLYAFVPKEKSMLSWINILIVL